MNVVDETSPVITRNGNAVVTSTTGTYIVIYNAVDGAANAATQVTRTVVVQDTTPPTITSSVAVPDALWPPNHKMHEIVCGVTATDSCTPAEALVITLVSITSDEFDNGFGVGDGNTNNDIQVAADGTISLRAERQGRGDGRIYTIVYSVTDGSGNFAQATCTVEVPHNSSSHSCDSVDCDLNSM